MTGRGWRAHCLNQDPRSAAEMQSLASGIRSNTPYLFAAAGVVWLAAVVVTGSLLVLWPVLACVLSGVFLKAYPGSRFTSAWAGASALMGLALAAYQVYVAAPLVSGAFATIAWTSIVAFSIFAVFHVYLLAVSGARRPVK